MRVLNDLNSYGEGLLTNLIRTDPDKAFECITRIYEENDDSTKYDLRHILSRDGLRGIGDETPGPIQFIPAKILFAWVDEDIDSRGYWLAGALPLTLDTSVAGRMTRDFIARYADGRTIRSGSRPAFSFAWLVRKRQRPLSCSA